MTPKFVIRTVKNGTVKVSGKVFIPDPEHYKEYDGGLDGKRFAFGTYINPGEDKPYALCLWGTEEDFYSADPNIQEPVVDEDGYFKWEYWATF